MTPEQIALVLANHELLTIILEMVVNGTVDIITVTVNAIKEIFDSK